MVLDWIGPGGLSRLGVLGVVNRYLSQAERLLDNSRERSGSSMYCGLECWIWVGYAVRRSRKFTCIEDQGRNRRPVDSNVS
jgi:hypothetical protein